MSVQPSEKDVFSMAIGRTVRQAVKSPALQTHMFSLIAGQCESDVSAAIGFN